MLVQCNVREGQVRGFIVATFCWDGEFSNSQETKESQTASGPDHNIVVRRGLLYQHIFDLLHYVNCNGQPYSGGTGNSLTLFDALLQPWSELMTKLFMESCRHMQLSYSC